MIYESGSGLITMIEVDEDSQILLGSLRSNEVEFILASYALVCSLLIWDVDSKALLRGVFEQDHDHRWL
jgi:hypothetical protein